MDIGAYAQIEKLEEVAKANGIYCPRLRGYRLMKDEDPIYLTKELAAPIAVRVCEDMCCSVPFWDAGPVMSEYSRRTRARTAYFISPEGETPRYIRWDRIRGWKRKKLKTAIHNQLVRYRKQYDVWNKYAGRDDVLYIHARIGGGNWRYYYRDVVNQPWFLEAIDDAFDSTYCDIYALIKGGGDA